MQEQIATYGGPVSVLAAVVLLLVKDKLKNGKNGKHVNECPLVKSGGTPMSKEQHDEMCNAKIQLVNEKLEHLKEGQTQVRKDVGEILKKVNNGYQR